MKDQYGREIRYLRISVTDRCNLHCKFCMPGDGYAFMDRDELLTLHELERVVDAALMIGIQDFRITGGEPLMRHDTVELIGRIKKKQGVRYVAMTTNGVLLESRLRELEKNGLDSLNISLCSMEDGEYEQITGLPMREKVLSSILKASESSITTKVNCVPMSGQNDDQILNLAELAKNHKIHMRFIEMMPIGEGNSFKPIQNDQILTILEEQYGKATPVMKQYGSGPARYWNFDGFQGSIGFISAWSHKFCGECNRVRMTANGWLKLCLCQTDGMDIRKLLREDYSTKSLAEQMEQIIYRKPAQHNFETGETREQHYMGQIGG